MCTTCMLSARGGWKRVFDPLELELMIIVRYHMDVGNETQVLRESSEHS